MELPDSVSVVKWEKMAAIQLKEIEYIVVTLMHRKKNRRLCGNRDAGSLIVMRKYGYFRSVMARSMIASMAAFLSSARRCWDPFQ